VWEYRKIALNELPRKADEIGLLCDAGEDGWELVAILSNNVAYLKRKIGSPDLEETKLDQGGEKASNDLPEEASSQVKVKYRDPQTGETWSGRGRMATWLRRKQNAGEDIENYRI
jgi:DNA-binding protein H-NS